MIDEKKLIEELESLPLIHGRYDHEHANSDFISGIETWHETVLKKINEQTKICPKFSFPTTAELAKEVAEKAMDEYEYKGKTIRQWVDEIQKHEWIPVSDRLPDKHIVLCDVFYPAEDECDKDFHNIRILNYVGNGEFRNPWDDLQNVVAWMPLPEPYKAGD